MSQYCSRWLYSLLCLVLAWNGALGQTVLDVIRSSPNLSTLSSILNATTLPAILGDSSRNWTVFAPTNSAFRNAFGTSSFTCTTDYYSVSACTSLDQLLSSTDLNRIAANLVTNGNWTYSSLVNGLTLQFLGGAVSMILVTSGGPKSLGLANVLAGEIGATNGVLLSLAAFPPADISLNSSAIASSALVGNFGPFTINQRIAMAASGPASSTADLPSLQLGYQRTRQIIDLPQGGIIHPMSISYDPTAMYRLMRASPTGYSDSEAAPSVTGLASAPSLSSTPTSSALFAYSTLANTVAGSLSSSPLSSFTSRPSQAPSASQPSQALKGSQPSQAPATAFLQTAQTLSSSSNIPGVGESGVLAGQDQADVSALQQKWSYPVLTNVTRPASNDSLAFMSILELGSLFRQRLVTSVELVQIFTERLRRYDYVLEAVITYTTSLAMEQAKAADAIFQRGTYLGPLHGIPYGLKDLMAVRGYPTTWGAPQFRNQYINADSNVYTRLSAAGAVLIAKLVTGEMAYDDVWFGGRTKNPWNILEGSSGSSAGPTASVVAATVPFSVGTETEGSLMSPASVCGSTSMRPSLGSIGRSWSMTLADSLDKVGPICRTAQDCAVVFDLLRGKDDADPASRDANLIDPFTVNVSRMTVGYSPLLQTAAVEVLSVLGARGVTLKPFTLNYSVNPDDLIKIIMISETAAHFDYWQRSGQDAQNRQQTYWPPLLRNARTIPAVEYIQAQRARGILATQILSSMKAAGIDAFVANSTTELAACNLVGIPTVSLPIGFQAVSQNSTDGRRNPQTVGFFGWPNGEPEVLALAMAWQNATKYHLQQPPIDNVSASVLSQCIPYSRCTLPFNGTAPTPAPSIEVSVADVG